MTKFLSVFIFHQTAGLDPALVALFFVLFGLGVHTARVEMLLVTFYLGDQLLFFPIPSIYLVFKFRRVIIIRVQGSIGVSCCLRISHLSGGCTPAPSRRPDCMRLEAFDQHNTHGYHTRCAVCAASVVYMYAAARC